jgi:hypothetical protein
MLDEKELEQIAAIVKRTKEQDDDGCGTIVAGVIILLAIFGAYMLAIMIFE